MKEKFPENLLHVKSMQQEVSEHCAKRSKQSFLNRYCSLFDHWKICKSIIKTKFVSPDTFYKKSAVGFYNYQNMFYCFLFGRPDFMICPNTKKQ